MKNIFQLLLILVSIALHSQEYPLNYEDRLNIPQGSYLKDIDGELNPYVGLWKGTWDGKIIYLQLKKVKYPLGNPNEPHFMYRDKIFGERKIINTDGSISVDRISTFDSNQYHEFSGVSKKFSNPSQKQLYFAPKDMCGKTANLDVIFLDAAKTQMSLHLIYNPTYMFEDCPYYNTVNQGGDFPINFPKDIVLTKQ